MWVEVGDDAGRIALELVGGDDAEAGLGAEHDDGDHQGLREAVSVAVREGDWSPWDGALAGAGSSTARVPSHRQDIRPRGDSPLTGLC